MPSVAFGAAALIVSRSFMSAARLSFGAAAMYSATVFWRAVFAAGFFFVSVAMRSTSLRKPTWVIAGGRRNLGNPECEPDGDRDDEASPAETCRPPSTQRALPMYREPNQRNARERNRRGAVPRTRQPY